MLTDIGMVCTQVRLSILFAYMFGKSQVAVQLLRWLGHAWALLRAGLEPVLAVVGRALSLAPCCSAWPALLLHACLLQKSCLTRCCVLLGCRPPLEAAWLGAASLAASGKLLAGAWGAYLGNTCSLLLGAPARAAWAVGKALLELLLLPVWQAHAALQNRCTFGAAALDCCCYADTLRHIPMHPL